ncbi:MAG: HNH endonuclease, partial [Planctomycetaceae bacterium]|nr:HNH endonuclease [Planctomycetaceae bacterium]
RTLRSHRVAYKIFFGVDPLEQCVLHTCDNPVCVNPNHLWLGSNADNMRDRHEKGRYNKGGKNEKNTGSKNGGSKLSESQVVEILTSNLNSKQLSKKLYISRKQINAIKRGEQWKHLHAKL